MRRDTAAHTRARNTQRLEKLALRHIGVIHMRHVHQVHRLASKITHVHADIEQRRSRPQRDTGARAIMIAKPLNVFVLPAQAQEHTVCILSHFQPGTIHRRAGHFAVYRMVVLR